MTLSGADRAILTMNLAEGIGWRTYTRLVERFGGAEAAVSAGVADLETVSGVGRVRAESLRKAHAGGAVDFEISSAADNCIDIISHTSDGYPAALKQIPDPPLVLYVKGRLLAEDAVALAFVGSRRASLYGLRATGRLAGQAARAGFTIVSGLARGIDRAAHEAALECGGRTIGVMGSGLLNLYPTDALDLTLKITDHGAIVSEFPLTFPSRRENFPRRNRIISGLSLGVVVVEAARRSGSLITARHAAEQGREVFAVPGPIDSPGSFGPNGLIRDGAKLVADLADITSDLGVLEEAVALAGVENLKDLRAATLNGVERTIFDALDREPVSVDDIIERTGLEPSVVSSTLLILEMKRLVTQLSGNRFAKS